MKNHKYMLAMLLSSSLLVGCQGDFLNLPSETSLSTAVSPRVHIGFLSDMVALWGG